MRLQKNASMKKSPTLYRKPSLIYFVRLLLFVVFFRLAAAEQHKIYPIAIVGAGAAGTMAVQRTVLDNHEVLLFTGNKQDQKRSCGNWVKKVDNVPGLSKYKRPILDLRDEVLAELAQSPLGSNLYVIEDSVCSIEKQDGIFKLVDR